ncbi:APC family permease [bacterium]|nr:APC family permease [bacterium]
MKQDASGSIGLWQAVAMAVGTMIGASIFSIFGVGAELAKEDLPLAFLLSGGYAIIVAYSYAKLAPRIVSNAGPIAFILKGIGDNLATGVLSVLMWLTYVVSVALFAKGFGGYLLPLIGFNAGGAAMTVAVIAVVMLFTVLNFFGSKAVGKAELYFVIIKVGILMVFVGFGALTVKQQLLQPSFSSTEVNGLLHASVIFFLSYMGFGLITNASEHIRDAKRIVPRAIYISIGIVLFVYVAVSVTAVGNLTIAQLTKASENALAIAAEPFLGKAGFLLISIGALFSIASALNATLYGGANVSYALAKDGELPEFFERKMWFGSVEGLYITAALSAALAVLVDLGGIAALNSTIFTVIYIFVLISHFRLASEVGGSRILLGINILIISTVFCLLIYYQWQSSRTVMFVTFGVFAGALIVESVFRYGRKRLLHIVHKIEREF